MILQCKANSRRPRSGRSSSPTAGSFLRPQRAIDEDVAFLDALKSKYAPFSNDAYENMKAIKISGKTVHEVGFEKINQQFARLSGLRTLVLDGLRIYGLVSRYRVPSSNHWSQARSQALEALQVLGMHSRSWISVATRKVQAPKLKMMAYIGENCRSTCPGA